MIRVTNEREIEAKPWKKWFEKCELCNTYKISTQQINCGSVGIGGLVHPSTFTPVFTPKASNIKAWSVGLCFWVWHCSSPLESCLEGPLRCSSIKSKKSLARHAVHGCWMVGWVTHWTFPLDTGLRFVSCPRSKRDLFLSYVSELTCKW